MTRPGRPSLLAVSGLPPWPMRGGFSLRAAHLVRELARDWEITLIAPGAGPQSSGDPWPGVAHRPIDLGPRWQAVPRGGVECARLESAVARELSRRRPDAVLLWPGTEFVGLSRAGFPPAIADRVDSATLERLRALRRSPGRIGGVLRAAWYERRIVTGLAGTVVAGEEDARTLIRLGADPTKVAVARNGVVPQEEARFDREAAAPTVVFPGTLDYPPNVEAARRLVTSIWPRVRRAVPDARLVIAGRRPGPKILRLGGGGGVTVLGDVPDMVGVIQSGWLVVAPMRLGTGVKNKVLEGWAAGRPVVLTELAANGLCLDAASRELISGGDGAFAEVVVGLLTDRDRRHRLGRAALDLVRARHSWRGAADGVSRMLRSAATARPTSA